jgi:cellulose synthase/poly-beta-1,6-N-acetylglucosamine synthase-like glycosyltransferase
MTVIQILFIASVAFLLYVLAGYPLLLWLMARQKQKARNPVFEPKSVTVLLPVHNGGKWLERKLQSLLQQNYPLERVDVVVISDGSTDNTADVARQFSDRGVQLLTVPKGGKASALNAGMEIATGEIAFFTDVRQPLERDCLRNLVSRFADPQVGAVCGELIILDGETQEELSVGLYWKLEKWIRKQLSATGSLLVVTGCLYAARRALIEPLPPDALGDDIFTPQSILRKGSRVVFEPLAKAYDYPTALDVEFRRKVRTLAGLYQYVLRHGMGPYPFHFFSYKVSRLLMPWALLLTAATTPFLGRPWAEMAAAAQVAVYGLALLDPLIPGGPLKRLSSPARTFCTLMIAALMAASVLFVPAADLWTTTNVRQPKTPAA